MADDSQNKNSQQTDAGKTSDDNTQVTTNPSKSNDGQSTKRDTTSAASTNDDDAYLKPYVAGRYITPIVQQMGKDTESGVWGVGDSSDNGAHFYVQETMFGRKYRQIDADRLWPFLSKFVAKTVSRQGTPDVQTKLQQEVNNLKEEVDSLKKQIISQSAKGGKA